MRNPGELDGVDLIEAVRGGHASARSFCGNFIQRIRKLEDQVHAFAHFDQDETLRQADLIDGEARKGRLAGLPIGVKDIFDTSNFRTEYGSPIYKGHQPSRDSPVVARLRAEGAVLMGKTATTEFAFMHTGPTRNPHGLTRTPGSSSAGSAAGMAAGFFPVALGTQTAGSLIKPASYCGSFAYKPTFGLISLEGVKPLAPSLDTIGWFGRSVADLELIATVLLGHEYSTSAPPNAPLRLVVARTDFWPEVEPSSKVAFETAVETLLERGQIICETPVPFDYRRLAAAHQVVNDREGSRALAFECERHASLVSDAVIRMRENALRITYAEEGEARAYIQSTAMSVDRFMMGCDAILTLSTAHAAPEGLASTGTSDFIKTWNALGMPQVNLPIASRPGHMPIGLQLIGQRGADARVLDAARRVSQALGIQCSEVVPLRMDPQ